MQTIDDTLLDRELLAQFCQAYRNLADALMDEIGVFRGQSGVLCKLFAHDGATQTELARTLGLQGATVTNMLQRMEDCGLVARRRDAEDNRLVRVYLTEKGRDVERAAARQYDVLEARLFDGMDADDRAGARRLLRRMLHNMTADRRSE